jgi:hypothetical protein
MRLMRASILFSVTSFVVASQSVAIADDVWLVPPVDALVARSFEAPTERYGPGHRGVDFAVAAGTAVRAAADGRVKFAGSVAGVQAVTLAHEAGLETTYTALAEILVAEGQVVRQGEWIARSGTSHGGLPGLHLGAKIDGEYVDPTTLLGPIDATSAVRLVSLDEETDSAEEAAPECSARTDLTSAEVPPNGNIAVAIAGIGSKTQGTVSAEMYEQGPEYLGYPEKRIFRFSYRGIDGPRLHEPYSTVDTFGDLKVAASRLRTLLVRIGRRNPGVPVDLIAHSQGGVVARTLLSLGSRSWDPDMPRIDHLVTFATPHQGAPASGAAATLGATETGRFLIGGLSRLANAGAPLPDPLSPAAREMEPGSELMNELAATDVLWGTQVLALGIPNDVVVPADRAMWPEKLGRIVPPRDRWGHGSIVSSPAARGLAYDFLRNDANPCPTTWDSWGPRVGRAVGAVETTLPRAYRIVEEVSQAGTAVRVIRAAAAPLTSVGKSIWGLARHLPALP